LFSIPNGDCMRAYHLLHRLIVFTAIGIVPIAALSQRSPQARTLEAKRDEAKAGREAASSWIAGSPSIGVGQRSDRWTAQNGMRETEVSLSAPIWLPGQKAARETVAQNSAEDLEAQIAHARLMVAGEVRERLWAVAMAREALVEAQDHLHHLEGLADEVMRRVKAGDLARTDGLLAQQEMLAAKNLVATAQAKERETITRYMTLTGQTDIPQAEPEPLAASIQDPHPRILATRSAVAKAQASLHAVNAIRRDPPTVGLSMRQERDAYASDSSKSVGIALQIPLGTRSRNRPLETAAHTQIATATAEATQAEATLQADIELAKKQLAATQSALDAATERAALTREHTQLIEKAFRLGERGLAEVLRSQAMSHEAEVAERQQRVAVGLAHARLNQALGIVP
jgi:outer membrane protein, heavy metal efflux system